MDGPSASSGSANSPSGKPVWVEALGLTVVYEPHGFAPKADIVFVHGLQGHPWRTWRYKGPVTEMSLQPKNPSSMAFGHGNSTQTNWERSTTRRRVYWPAELLPATYPDIRVLTYGYDSHVSNWFKGPANKMTVTQHGRSLLNDLARERQACRGRPVVFVAHSLGGLVAKEALIEARKQIYHSQLQEIYQSCKAIIFFGTPHRGSGAAKWGALLGNIASAAQFDTNIGILKDLDPNGGTTKLEELRRDFNDLLEDEKIKIHTFQEGTGITGLKLASNKVVPDESSSFDSRKFEVVDTISANHMSMCRFGSKNDEGYNKFVGALAVILGHVHSNPEEISKRIEAERLQAEWREKLLQSLHFAEMQARENQLSDADSATFDWIWRSGFENCGFVSWLSCKRGLFWISGKPGSGKSMLMNYLAGESKTRLLLQKSTDLPWTIINFFFDFRAGKGVANNLEGLLRTLLLQLVEKVPELTTRVLQFSTPVLIDSQFMDWSATKLRRSLQDALEVCPCNVCIFVDGLDEYEGNLLDLVEILRKIDDKCENLTHTVKLCLASRPEPLLLATLQESAGFRMQDHNIDGIKRYIESTLKSIRSAAGDEVFLKMSNEIAQRSEGVFLWARLAMNDMIEGHVTGDTQLELLERLKQVPSDLKDVYSRIFIRLKSEHKDEANTILLLACSAKRTLTLAELFFAFNSARKIDIPEADDSYSQDAVLNVFRRRMLARSGGLLEITVEGRGSTPVLYVKPIHETVRPFVINSQGVLFRTPIFQGAPAPRSLWVEICVTVLQEAVRKVKLHRRAKSTADQISWAEKSWLRLSEQFELAKYAACYLFDHARDLEILDGVSSYEALRTVIALPIHSLHDHSARILISKTESGDADPGCEWCFVGKTSLGDHPWPNAVIHCLPKFCRDFLAAREGLIPYDEDKDPIGTAMNVIERDHRTYLSHLDSVVATLSLLVRHGVKVEDRHIIRALKTAPPRVLDALLKDRAAGNIRLKDPKGEVCGSFWTLMCKVCAVFFKSNVEYLLRRGEDLNDTCGPAGTALHAPLYIMDYNFSFRYRILLQNGADPNRRGPAGTPLRLFWKRAFNGRIIGQDFLQCQKLMELLLDYGAIVDWVDEDGTAPTEEEIRLFCQLGSEASWITGNLEELRRLCKSRRRADADDLNRDEWS